MEFKEGQIFKGNITISGGNNGPTRNWIIISPFNKPHLYSIDNPLDLHCWPLNAACNGLEDGYLKLVKTDTQHPAIQLQRDKEKLGISDIHMGLHGEALHKMFDLLGNAVANGKLYAPFVAGEILTLINCSLHSKKEVAEIRKRVSEHLLALQCSSVA